MGKRKKSSRKPQGPKKKEPLPTTFACLFCNHEKSITVKLDKKAGTGQLSCKVCGQQFQTGINYLSAAVDVYSDWIDACDTVAKEEASGRAPASGRAGYSGLVSSRRGDDEDEDLDGYAERGGGDGFIDDEHDPGHAASDAD